MTTGTQRATLADLARVKDKAELIGGRIVHLMASGRRPGRVAGRIYRSLDDFALKLGVGEAYPDGVGFTVPELTSGRESFCPDAAYFAGPFLSDPMRFNQGPPTFAVEVRSENDYSPAAEQDTADKRADYFEAGTLTVWDVDSRAETVFCYDRTNPQTPRVFRRGDMADAGAALPGWSMAVDDIFNV
jgi:Uma2 family endonuclease